MKTRPAKILVVDDDPAILRLISRFLQQKGHEVSLAENGHSALQTFLEFRPDLVILDVNLPDATGYSLCEQMQQHTGVYVLMLTGRTDSADKIRGFSKGADDYLTKPFDLQELEFRVGAILRRQRPTSGDQDSEIPSSTLVFGSLVIDSRSREVSLRSQTLPLTTLEFNLLQVMAQNENRAFKRQELIDAVWGDNYVGDERIIDVHIGQIRRKLQDAANYVRTVRGIGYKFSPPKSQI